MAAPGDSHNPVNPLCQLKGCSIVEVLTGDMEVATVQQRSRWMGIGAGVLGLTLTLVPLTAASAKSTKGSAPHSAMCQTVKSEQGGSTAASSAIEKAMTSGNFASAKQAMLSAFNVDFNQVQKALAVVKTAPPKVQAAFKDLLSYVKQLRTAIQNSTSTTSLLAAFETLGKNPKLQADSTTISNWYTGVCGGTLTTTPSTVASP
jgi:hypothetical protein